MKRSFVLLVIVLLGAAPTTTPSDLQELRQKALSEDFNVSRMGLKRLIAKGAPAKAVVGDVVRDLLTRDRAKIQENFALLADVAKYRATDAASVRFGCRSPAHPHRSQNKVTPVTDHGFCSVRANPKSNALSLVMLTSMPRTCTGILVQKSSPARTGG